MVACMVLSDFLDVLCMFVCLISSMVACMVLSDLLDGLCMSLYGFAWIVYGFV